MTPEQATQIAQITFVAILFIPALVIVGVLIAIAVKFLPVMMKQVQQLIDNNAQLTKIAQQNADQIESTELVLGGITPELVKHTNAVEAQTSEIKTQSLDFRNYQTLVSDNMSAHSSQLEATNATVNALKSALEALPQQIVAAIDDNLKCKDILKDIQTLRFEVAHVLSQQQTKRATGTMRQVDAEGS